MALSSETRRRMVGLVFLALAIAMLVAGLTVLAPRLRGVVYLVYWLGCMGFTGLAVLTALLDVWATRQRIRQAQRALLSQAIAEFPDRRPTEKSPRATSGLSKPAAGESITPASGRKVRSP